MAGNKNSGRQPMSIDKLPDNWKEIVRNIYSVGGSDVELRVELGISNTGWYSLIENDTIFSETIKNGKELCEAWWLRTGRTGLWQQKDAPQLNYTGWYMQMKNRFGWADKQEVKNSGVQKIIIEEEIIGGSEDKD